MSDYNIESGVIGCLLVSPEDIGKTYETVKPEMFEHFFCRKVFEEMVSCFLKGENVDAELLADSLRKDNPGIDWYKELSALLINSPTSTMLPEYSKRVLADHTTARLTDFFEKEKFNSNNVFEFLAATQTFIESLKTGRTSHKSTMAELSDYAVTCTFVDTEDTSIKTGLSKLDSFMKIEPQEITVIGARPSVGKSALALVIAINVAKQGLRVAYFNLEMNKKHIIQRVIAHLSDIELARLVNAKTFLGDEEERFTKAVKSARSLPIDVFTGSFSDLDIYAECRFKNYDLVVIDYLQLIKCESKKSENRRVEVGAVSRKLKEMAMELNFPIILLSQLTRNSEFTPDKEPTMADLRETGDIEQDATNILLMWNLSDEDEYRSFKGLKVDKNRQGELMKESLDFQAKHMKFVEFSKSLAETKKFIERGQGVVDDFPFN